MVVFLGIIGFAVVVVLSVIAWRMWRKVWAMEARQKVYQDEALANEQKRLDHIHESLNVIASAILDDQVRIAEAGIRMAALLSNLPLSCESKHRYAPLFEVYNRTQHIPTHSKWKALDKKQQRSYEKELFELEGQLGDDIREIARYIKANPFGDTLSYSAKH